MINSVQPVEYRNIDSTRRIMQNAEISVRPADLCKSGETNPEGNEASQKVWFC